MWKIGKNEKIGISSKVNRIDCHYIFDSLRQSENQNPARTSDPTCRPVNWDCRVGMCNVMWMSMWMHVWVCVFPNQYPTDVRLCVCMCVEDHFIIEIITNSPGLQNWNFNFVLWWDPKQRPKFENTYTYTKKFNYVLIMTSHQLSRNSFLSSIFSILTTFLWWIDCNYFSCYRTKENA